MINEEELRISNKSYINKDFASIYPEVIQLVKKLTNLWDPESSNESDPGIVLLKLLSFIADKNNYNIDKNVLETFMPSATQESSMRKLCDMLGYFMNYYNAPTTSVVVRYVGDLSDKNPITLEALNTVFTSSDEDSNISFIATKGCVLDSISNTSEVPVIQGRLKELLVNTSADISTSTSPNQSGTLVQLNNLDSNNRIYFPEINVAQNGIFIYDDTSTSEPWKRVNNLNYQKANEKCYKFGFDSIKGLPYIEFPNNISDIIGSGLYIRYVVTDGLNGNVKAGTINKLQSGFDWEGNGYSDSERDNLFVRNYNATIDGANPESIDEAYNGFKKTIGTFDTLVTCRDYANAIYKLLDSEGIYNLVSNVQVSDRRDDINYSKRVVSYDELGECVINKTDSSELNAYQLCAYTFAPIYSYSDVNAYNESFTSLTKELKTVNSEITNSLDNYKTISHDFKVLANNDIYAFINKLTLNGRLTTTHKVNANEVLDIDTNVINQLIKDFNSRNVDFGYEMPYDSLVNSIQKADKRINFVSLMEPTLTTYVLKPTDVKPSPLISSDNQDAYITLLSKNILNGNVSLFDYDTRFKYELGHVKLSDYSMVNENITKIEPELTLTLTDATSIPLYRNEAIQLIGPNYITKLTYPAYCYFRFESTVHSDSQHAIAPNTVYELGAGEKLTMLYTSSSGIQTVDTYEAGDIIKANFNLYATPSSTSQQAERSIYPKVVNGITYYFYSLTASEQIEIKQLNKVELTKKTKCYWLRNTVNNRLFTDSEWDESTGGNIILSDNEYFFYTDAAETQLITLGSGTTIKTELSSLKDATCNVVSLDNILEMGPMLALKDRWKVFDFSIDSLTVEENLILTLTENDSITVNYNEDATQPLTIGSAFTPIDSDTNIESIEYKYNGSDNPESLDMYGVSEGEWKIRTRLLINVTKDEPQVINDGIEGSVSDRQEIRFFNTSSTSEPIVTLNTSGNYFNLNLELHSDGGNVEFEPKLVNDESLYQVAMYCYDIDSTNGLPDRGINDYAKYELSSDISTVCTFNVPVISTENALIMMHYLKSEESGDLKVTCTNCTIQRYNESQNDNFESSIDLNAGINVLEIKCGSGIPSITVTNGGNVGILTLGTLDFYTDFNPALSLDKFSAETTVSLAVLKNALKDTIRDSEFYYNCRIDNSKALEYDDLLSPYAFYDSNNRANKFTLSQIDFETSDIDVVRSSKL